jgi:DNA-directed RNA polymerase subunit RPC12/RpoP
MDPNINENCIDDFLENEIDSDEFMYSSEDEYNIYELKKVSEVKKPELTSSNNTEPNIKCGSCKKKFTLDKKQNNIRCIFCGHRILHKLRTKNSIYYNTN